MAWHRDSPYEDESRWADVDLVPTCHDGLVKVLVVEDDPAISGPLVEGLVRNGFEVEHVAYASQVVAAAADADVVILDLGLPDGDGLEVLRELRRTSDVPVIIATARAAASPARGGSSAG